jgi:hypothetical protein
MGVLLNLLLNCFAGGRHRDVSNEYPVVITKILSHLNKKNDETVNIFLPESRAPPQASLFA